MVFKHFQELTASELRTELKRAGIKGKFVKADAIMRLTAHLIDVSEDPFTFEFDPEIAINELADDDNPGDYEVTNDVHEPVISSDSVGSTAASASVNLGDYATTGRFGTTILKFQALVIRLFTVTT